ncbi:S1C family serine protease [Amedibacterium intestinale]|uniref:Protease n=1 Tax=Amedibacterium intestinale TaxID=2583452 RepID=A0A6N4THG6_9FIRM|nr:trypsin-like peptidase domain-containing protein [Amedibacterium intestinale]RHO23059.1 PDZ domain-containing protein [Eubacterium sp. AM18-26]RHO26146.1 PDZ domain-containing protein [Erysipelotrichaceae bacterium AM17-60]RHO28517.1 PDZ domain-containing protein [Eubacterium sp. AM18-10LB-B]BBK22308.1 protease [Amedibacterium intestinale]BBK62360.1 protease [Amedibacterium intestinale]
MEEQNIYNNDENIDASFNSQQHAEAKKGSKKTMLVLCGCFILAGIGGFGGTMAALSLNGGTGRAVLYQSVTNTENGSDKGSVDANAMSVKQVADATANSVVEIQTESVSTNPFFPQAVTSGAGSGVILSKDGYIVTNNHVIEGASKVTVKTKDGKSYNADFVGTDKTTDLAVIKIKAENLTPAVLGKSADLEVGDVAIAIGNPLGELGGTVTSGIISALDREINVDNQSMHLLQTSAAINPGNSGGGLFNDHGELVGIVNAKSGGENIEGLGFAIPIDHAKTVIENLIENGYVKGRPSLGVVLQAASTINSDKENVYIAEVEKGKAADKAGLKTGDQILKADGKNVTSISDVKEAIDSHKAGDNMSFTILRENETKEIKVKLGEADTTQTETQSYQNNTIPFGNQ